MFNAFAIDFGIAAFGSQEDFVMGGDFNLAFSGDEFEHLVGDDFDRVTLCLDLHFSFGGEGGQAFALGKQADAFADAGDQSFAHAQVGVFA